MRSRNDIAEDVLSLAATREQAKTILGDLLEARPGVVVFWFVVLQATVSLAKHQPRRPLVAFLWFMYEPAFLAIVLTLAAVGKHVFSPLFMGLILIGLVCICYWILWSQEREPSVITVVWFWLDLLKCDGLGTLAIVLLLPLNPFFWWVHWQQYQRRRAAKASN